MGMTPLPVAPTMAALTSHIRADHDALSPWTEQFSPDPPDPVTNHRATSVRGPGEHAGPRHLADRPPTPSFARTREASAGTGSTRVRARCIEALAPNHIAPVAARRPNTESRPVARRPPCPTGPPPASLPKTTTRRASAVPIEASPGAATTGTSPIQRGATAAERYGHS